MKFSRKLDEFVEKLTHVNFQKLKWNDNSKIYVNILLKISKESYNRKKTISKLRTILHNKIF